MQDPTSGRARKARRFLATRSVVRRSFPEYDWLNDLLQRKSGTMLFSRRASEHRPVEKRGVDDFHAMEPIVVISNHHMDETPAPGFHNAETRRKRW